MGSQIPFDDECFVIAPIGAPESSERRRSDVVLNYIIRPALEPLNLTPVRADQIAAPGQITSQVVEHLLNARGVVADLTGANPNVYYELAVRHTARLPVVLLAEDTEQLPFDLAQMRTIFVDHRNLESASACTDLITEQLQRALEGAVESPIAASIDVRAARVEGGRTDRLLGDLAEQIEGLSAEVRRALSRAGSEFPTNVVRDGDLYLETVDTKPGEPIVLKAQGAIVDNDTARFKDRLRPLVEASEHLIIDLSETTYIDATGLGVLVGGSKALQPQNKRMALVPSDGTARILEVSGLDQAFLVAPTVARARELLRAPPSPSEARTTDDA